MTRYFLPPMPDIATRARVGRTLLEKLGPVSIATASLHLRRPGQEVASAVASLLAALPPREDGGAKAEHQQGGADAEPTVVRWTP